ncbi:hypothetical protein SM124_23670 [Bacillus sp. 31A1R]|uniref:Uncharacterized protein n=1 Tax=Robertmurraya mangrovi TaxID=3098077 RepID=A0ABU5J5E6_9BACI|nr:hypothetical protein [Bacillus sp. 31A1R]MDZ5474644.1 hypothetical protein [Bacillus sp. 31A1R]
MKQVVEFNEQLKVTIMELEKTCEHIANQMERKHSKDFSENAQKIIVELVRGMKGKAATENDVFEEDYESYIEVAIECGEEYHPNAYIPIWKCKNEWFQMVGYITTSNSSDIELKLDHIVREILEENY